eukprot:CAMPEP_0197921398 /NCGR_PEP_ID=MMETSP1439-20131203/90564_1 /TAXON_ID=66791 /ORGANISM="Gonyaulax spinifera, Strain CCMP409" /LENGTH=91 /DNA_ID=CAMNT_0043543647 /DNA_START=57 /DNA_END=330 /DNA_ORIENTATION=+
MHTGRHWPLQVWQVTLVDALAAWLELLADQGSCSFITVPVAQLGGSYGTGPALTGARLGRCAAAREGFADLHAPRDMLLVRLAPPTLPGPQ